MIAAFNSAGPGIGAWRALPASSPCVSSVPAMRPDRDRPRHPIQRRPCAQHVVHLVGAVGDQVHAPCSPAPDCASTSFTSSKLRVLPGETLVTFTICQPSALFPVQQLYPERLQTFLFAPARGSGNCCSVAPSRVIAEPPASCAAFCIVSQSAPPCHCAASAFAFASSGTDITAAGDVFHGGCT